MKVSTSAIWLQIASALAILFGVFSVLASFPPTQGGWLLLFDLLKWPIDGDPASFDVTGRALNAVLGGVLIGWGTLMFFLVRHLFPSNEVSLRKVLLASVISWFVFDSAGSCLAGFPGNVILNVGFLIVFVPPLVFVKRSVTS